MKKRVLIILLIVLINFVFIDFVGAVTYNNYDPASPVSCGNNLMTDIPPLFPKVISIIYSAIQVAVPVVLVIMGSLDLTRGIAAGKEEDIKKGRQAFIKRLIYGALIFFVFIIVKLVIGFAAEGTGNKILDCTQCFISNECKK